MPQNSTADALGSIDTRMLIGGQWTDASSGGRFEKINPATEQVLAELPAGEAADIDRAVASAREQLSTGPWSTMPGPERGKLLHRLADLVERDSEMIARVQAEESGQPIGEPRFLDVPKAVDTFRYYAGWADKIEGAVLPITEAFGEPAHSYRTREPIGVVGMILPWNSPVMILSWKLAPALAAGCTAVIKPAEDAMLTVLQLGKLIEEAGFPPGVVNIVTGLGETAGAALASHPGVDKISFTGSLEVGKAIQRQAADRFIPVTLELGGKSPTIIFPDADMGAAVESAARALFVNQGQVCAAGTRVIAHESCYSEVVEGLKDAAESIVLGAPFDESTQMGSLINAKQLERVMSYIELGQSEGARLVTGGERHGDRGYYVRPTIFADVDRSMRIAQDEIFGPVGSVMSFQTFEEAVDLANDSVYGLSASVWTKDLSKAHLIGRALDTGTIWVNAWGLIDPRQSWGGRKASGIGRELGWAGIEACTVEKVVTMVLPS